MDLVFTGLLVFLVVGAVVALEMKDLLSGIVALGAVGLGLSILFLLLGAPDIAITQVVVEVIVVTVLIRAAGANRGARPEGRRRDLPAVCLSIALLGVLLGLSIAALRQLPPFGEPRPQAGLYYLDHALPATGASNVVMAILLDFRGFDTLGEATVILASILGAVVVLRSRTPPVGRPAEPVSPDRPARIPEAVHGSS